MHRTEKEPAAFRLPAEKNRKMKEASAEEKPVVPGELTTGRGAEIRPQGSMTIYLMLTMIIVLVLICTLVESARVSAVSANIRSLTYMGMDSVFSEFAQPVFDDYGIMVLWKSDEEFVSEFSEYVNANLDVSELSYSANADLYGISLTGNYLVSSSMITDDAGLLFADQVYEYMEYYMLESAAETLLEELDIFGQSDIVSDFMDTLSEYSEVFTEVEEKVSAVKEAIEKIRSISEDPRSLLDELYDTASGFSEEDGVYSEFSSALAQLKNVKSELESALEDIQEYTDEYYESVDEAKEAAAVLEESLLSKGEDLDEEIYASLEEQVSDLVQKSTDTDADYYEVGANEETVQEYIDMLESLENLFGQLDEGLSSDNAGEYADAIAQYQEIFSSFDLDELGVNLDTSAVETEDRSILEYIGNLIDKGVLAYVKDDVSEKTTETDELPSVSVDSSSEDDEETIAQATANKVIFGQYVLEHFGNAVETKEDTALDYEVEYILGGKDSDVGNLKVVVNRIVALRSSLNFISILQDSAKKNEAYTLATAMVGFTGMPLLITAFQILILTAWSMAEAVTDVKALLEGEKVPTIKNSTQWNLSIEDFKNFTGKDIETVSYESGLEYEDYLRVLLAMQGKQKQYYRTMDVIQLNMCLNENENFRMTDCMVSAQISTSFSANRLFTAFSWVDSSLTAAGGGWTFTLTQDYEY